MAKYVLVGFDVLVPIHPLLHVGRACLPKLCGIIEAGLQAISLLILADMEEEFQDDDVVAYQHLLEGIDFIKAMRELLRGKVAMDANHQNILIMRAVEDSDHAMSGNSTMDTPEKIVVKLFGRRLLETSDLATLRVHAGEDMADCAILTPGIESLQHD